MAVPLVLIVGYLGAGKTSLLQRIIPALGTRGLRPRVILNDYQDARVDAARLVALDALVTPISGDCICCGSREELLEALAALDLDATSVVLIEANGTSDATELHDVLALDPRLSALSRPMQVTVVDARRWQKRWFDKTLEREQAVTASHLWVNWTEGLSARRMTSVMASLSQVNPHAQRSTTEELADDLAALAHATPDSLARIIHPGQANRAHHHHPARHHFASIGVELPGIVDRASLESLVRDLAPRLRRAKGVAGFTDSPTKQWSWSYIGGDPQLHIEALPASGFATVAVFIGADLDEVALAQRVESLRGAATGLGDTP